VRSAGLLWRSTRNQNRIFWRTRIGAFFSLVFPLLMLVLFVALFDDGEPYGPYGGSGLAQYFTPGLAVFSAASSTYTNIAIGLSSRRELGILKRVRGTPMPPWTYLGGVMLSATWVAVLGSTLMVLVGTAFYGVNIEIAKVPGLLVAFVMGSVTFAVLGVGVAGIAKSTASAVPIAQATMLPVAFVSDLFLPLDSAPQWLRFIGDVFPLKHFAIAFGEALSPLTDAPAIAWDNLAVIVVWLAAGTALAGSVAIRSRKPRTSADTEVSISAARIRASRWVSSSTATVMFFMARLLQERSFTYSVFHRIRDARPSTKRHHGPDANGSTPDTPLVNLATSVTIASSVLARISRCLGTVTLCCLSPDR